MTPKRDTAIEVRPGVTFRQIGGAGVTLMDIDLETANLKPIVVAEKVERIRNNFVGEAKTVAEWAEDYKAVAGLNAGFFGDTFDDVGKRKQIIQLALVNGKVVAPGSDTASTRTPGERYLRSVIGFRKDGRPEITYATGTIKNVVKHYQRGINPSPGSIWHVTSAVACGPRLFTEEKLDIADKRERLVSPAKLVRCFVAYDLVDGKPRHFIFGRVNAADFTDVANFLKDYYPRTHGTEVHDAMCLDGGNSAQLVYRDSNGNLVDATPTGVRVPTALLLIPK